MEYLNSMNICGINCKDISCITDSGAPTTLTEGAVGLLYMNTENGDIYKCTNVSDDGVYTWELLIAKGTILPQNKANKVGDIIYERMLEELRFYKVTGISDSGVIEKTRLILRPEVDSSPKAYSDNFVTSSTVYNELGKLKYYDNPNIEVTDEAYFYPEFEKGTDISTGNITRSTTYTDPIDIVIPFNIHGYFVTGIAVDAFEEQTNITSVVIPNSVTSIGNGAFKYCTGITSVVFPDSVKIIDDFAFGGCSNIISITLPNSVTSIGDGVFDGISPDAIFYVHAGSYAETYCKENGFNYKLLASECMDDTPTKDSDNLVTSGGVYKALQSLKPLCVNVVTGAEIPEDEVLEDFRMPGHTYYKIENVDKSIADIYKAHMAGYGAYCLEDGGGMIFQLVNSTETSAIFGLTLFGKGGYYILYLDDTGATCGLSMHTTERTEA